MADAVVIGKETTTALVFDPPKEGEKETESYSVKTKKLAVGGLDISYLPVEIFPAQIDIKPPEEALSAGSSRTSPVTYIPPRPGRAFITVKTLDGKVETYDNFYATEIHLSDREAYQLHDTFTGPSINTFDREPRVLNMTVALLNGLPTEVARQFSSKSLEGEGQQRLTQEFFDTTPDWRNAFRKFYEDKMRASRAEIVSIKIQNTIYSGHVVAFPEITRAESDSLTIGTIQMIVFEVLHPIGEAPVIITETFNITKPRAPEGNRGQQLIRDSFSKIRHSVDVIFRDDEQDVLADAVKSEQEDAA